MVLKMADLGMRRKSFKTLWNALYMLANGFPTSLKLGGEDLWWIWKSQKSADFEQKAWDIAHGFEDGGFEYVPGIVWKSLKHLVYACKWISNYFKACSWRFGVNSEESEIRRFWAKSLGYSPWFSRWRNWVRSGNGSKLSETPCTCFQMDLQLF